MNPFLHFSTYLFFGAVLRFRPLINTSAGRESATQQRPGWSSQLLPSPRWEMDLTFIAGSFSWFNFIKFMFGVNEGDIRIVYIGRTGIISLWQIWWWWAIEHRGKLHSTFNLSDSDLQCSLTISFHNFPESTISFLLSRKLADNNTVNIDRL